MCHLIYPFVTIINEVSKYITCYKDVEDFGILQHEIPSKIFIAKETFEVLNIAI